jgi:uncharacterized protein YjbI with pentapeptide repeats/predicted transcriptional regulator
VRTVVIKAIEIVQCIRSGMDDSALMKKFKISAKGLQKLFNELESAGILDRSELEERLTLSYASVIVDIDHAKLEPPPPTKLLVNALDARNCIRSGMDDATLMKRYNLSTRGLQSLFKKLLARGAVSHSDLTQRKQTGQDSFVVDEGAARPRGLPMASPPLDTKAILDSVRSGMSREALREKYKIFETELESVLARMVQEGLIDQAELNRRLPVTLGQFQIRRRFVDEIIYMGEATSFRALIESAVSENVDLSEAELGGINLARSSLCGARLSGANLRNTNLMGADLTGARLCGANLASADMSRAVLYKTNLAKADLSEANLALVQGAWAFLPEANLSEANLARADFSGANLAGAYLFEAIVTETNFDGAYLEKAIFEYDKSRKLR